MGEGAGGLVKKFTTDGAPRGLGITARVTWSKSTSGRWGKKETKPSTLAPLGDH